MTYVTVEYIKTHVPQPDDLVVWQDGTTCHYHELEEFSHMDDDYEIVPQDESVSLVINSDYVPAFAHIQSRHNRRAYSHVDWMSSDLK